MYITSEHFDGLIKFHVRESSGFSTYKENQIALSMRHDNLLATMTLSGTWFPLSRRSKLH